MNNVLAVLSLGLAGIDPIGMMLLMGMMAAGLPKQKIYLYAGLVLFGTTLLGFILSSLLGSGLSAIANSVNQFSDLTWVWINIFLIFILLAWGFRRLFSKKEKEEETLQDGKGVAAAALFMMFTAITDPTFLAVLALSGRHDYPLLSIFYNFLWVLISQAPLFLLTIAVALNQHQIFIKKFNAVYTKYKQKIAFGITILIFAAAAIFALDLFFYWTQGIWLIG